MRRFAAAAATAAVAGALLWGSPAGATAGSIEAETLSYGGSGWPVTARAEASGASGRLQASTAGEILSLSLPAPDAGRDGYVRIYGYGKCQFYLGSNAPTTVTFASYAIGVSPSSSGLIQYATGQSLFLTSHPSGPDCFFDRVTYDTTGPATTTTSSSTSTTSSTSSSTTTAPTTTTTAPPSGLATEATLYDLERQLVVGLGLLLFLAAMYVAGRFVER